MASSMYPSRPASTQPQQTGAREDQVAAEFVSKHLATALMRMEPKDGWVESGERNWVLAGGAADPVVVYSLDGNEIALTKPLPFAYFHATWIDPHTGAESAAYATNARRFTKPNDGEWLLVLEPEGRR